MSIINNTLLLTAGAEGPYEIERSLRFRSSASARLSRTPSTAGNRKTWTYSFWLKRGTIGPQSFLLNAGPSGADDSIDFAGDRIRFYLNGGTTGGKFSEALYRDPSAWYHFVFVCDLNNATAANRMQIWVNGVRLTAFSASVDPPSTYNTIINNSQAQHIGSRDGIEGFFDGYLTEINFVDGQALTPSSFGEFNALTGVWQPKAYAGTYGTNGFYLNFKDNASTSALGTDYSSNGNNWTTNNISLTAGATFDSMIDVPTPYDDGGNGRGNYCVLNPLNSPATTLSNANLTVATAVSGTNYSTGSFAIPTSGKWYWEYVGTTRGDECFCGVATATVSSILTYYGSTGIKWVNGSGSAYGATYTTNDVIGVAVDVDAGTVTFYKNNTSQGAITYSVTGDTFFPYFADGSSSVGSVIQANFGQRPFAYTPPTGFKALNTQNLPEPTIVDGGEYFNAVLYTGNGSNRSISGVGFSPDLVWIKSRNATYNNNVFDSVRGVEKYLLTDSTLAENGGSSGVGSLTAFDSDGFSLGTQAYINNNTTTFVAWNWRGSDSAAVTNTAGSITSTVSANPTAGFSVVTYSGNSTAAATVGHGLGVTPSMIITKRRDASSSWAVSHAAYANTSLLFLESTIALVTGAGTRLQRTNSSVFTVGDAADYNVTNASGGTYVAYCFSEVAGYSRFGSYTGNGSDDGPFVFCGFRPAFVVAKRIDFENSWNIVDSKRSPYNLINTNLAANNSNAEGTNDFFDFTSNGFKVRTSNGYINASGGTWIFMAFAENPFKYSLAR